MFITVSGVPAGYGYFKTPSVAKENIIPALAEYLKQNDVNKLLGAPIQIGTITIQVDADAEVRINGRAPILVKKDVGVTFDARGIFSIAFEGIVNYNILATY